MSVKTFEYCFANYLKKKIVVHNYFNVENITTYFTLKKIIVHNYFNDFLLLFLFK